MATAQNLLSKHINTCGLPSFGIQNEDWSMQDAGKKGEIVDGDIYLCVPMSSFPTPSSSSVHIHFSPPFMIHRIGPLPNGKHDDISDVIDIPWVLVTCSV